MLSSKKALYFILAVALIIFVVVLVIGQPWWQALLFGIGFLLMSALVFGGRGLIIPEMLLNRRLPKKIPEEANKEDFLKKMDSEMAEFSAQSEATTEEIHWMTEYTRVMKEVGELVYEVHESVKSKDKAKQSRSFRKAVKELPRLISQFKEIPELATAKDKSTIKNQAEGLDLYLLACSNFAEALENSDGNLAGKAAMQINEALALLDVMSGSQTESEW